ncbi:hypothetical protein CTheo_6004 [Ceratobasidium theobromae]|uniref:Transmembrane protein n=1 Tax=Ceratobasidium theobromae TaxID=1582974 RepID=A0A5N5QFP0_9AGAM|nr:hypothetical protein CTheo_6004 [Ceratobasidium theobromae]
MRFQILTGSFKRMSERQELMTVESWWGKGLLGRSRVLWIPDGDISGLDLVFEPRRICVTYTMFYAFSAAVAVGLVTSLVYLSGRHKPPNPSCDEKFKRRATPLKRVTNAQGSDSTNDKTDPQFARSSEYNDSGLLDDVSILSPRPAYSTCSTFTRVQPKTTLNTTFHDPVANVLSRAPRCSSRVQRSAFSTLGSKYVTGNTSNAFLPSTVSLPVAPFQHAPRTHFLPSSIASSPTTPVGPSVLNQFIPGSRTTKRAPFDIPSTTAPNVTTNLPAPGLLDQGQMEQPFLKTSAQTPPKLGATIIEEPPVSPQLVMMVHEYPVCLALNDVDLPATVGPAENVLVEVAALSIGAPPQTPLTADQPELALALQITAFTIDLSSSPPVEHQVAVPAAVCLSTEAPPAIIDLQVAPPGSSNDSRHISQALLEDCSAHTAHTTAFYPELFSRFSEHSIPSPVFPIASPVAPKFPSGRRWTPSRPPMDTEQDFPSASPAAEVPALSIQPRFSLMAIEDDLPDVEMVYMDAEDTPDVTMSSPEMADIEMFSPILPTSPMPIESNAACDAQMTTPAPAPKVCLEVETGGNVDPLAGPINRRAWEVFMERHQEMARLMPGFDGYIPPIPESWFNPTLAEVIPVGQSSMEVFIGPMEYGNVQIPNVELNWNGHGADANANEIAQDHVIASLEHMEFACPGTTVGLEDAHEYQWNYVADLTQSFENLPATSFEPTVNDADNELLVRSPAEFQHTLNLTIGPLESVKTQELEAMIAQDFSDPHVLNAELPETIDSKLLLANTLEEIQQALSETTDPVETVELVSEEPEMLADLAEAFSNLEAPGVAEDREYFATAAEEIAHFLNGSNVDYLDTHLEPHPIASLPQAFTNFQAPDVEDDEYTREGAEDMEQHLATQSVDGLESFEEAFQEPGSVADLVQSLASMWAPGLEHGATVVTTDLIGDMQQPGILAEAGGSSETGFIGLNDEDEEQIIEELVELESDADTDGDDAGLEVLDLDDGLAAAEAFLTGMQADGLLGAGTL